MPQAGPRHGATPHRHGACPRLLHCRPSTEAALFCRASLFVSARPGAALHLAVQSLPTSGRRPRERVPMMMRTTAAKQVAASAWTGRSSPAPLTRAAPESAEEEWPARLRWMTAAQCWKTSVASASDSHAACHSPPSCFSSPHLRCREHHPASSRAFAFWSPASSPEESASAPPAGGCAGSLPTGPTARCPPWSAASHLPHGSRRPSQGSPPAGGDCGRRQPMASCSRWELLMAS